MKIIKLIILLSIAQVAMAQNQKNVDSKVVKVTVFPQGAQVVRTAKTTVAGGKTELTFSGLSPYADASSIQVSGEGAFTILSVSPQANILKAQKKRKEIEEIEKSREAFQKVLIRHRASLDVYQKEEQMLEANQKVGGENVGLKAADLLAAMELHRTRLHELKFFEIDYNEKIQKVQDTLALINAQINEMNARADQSTTDLIVTVQSQTGSNADFTLSYVVAGAGWYPSYDLHVDDISKPLQLNYKANVYQNTGEEWKDVRLIFSNGNPNESGVAPVLSPYYLRNIDALRRNVVRGGSWKDVSGFISDSVSFNGARSQELYYKTDDQKKTNSYLWTNSNVNYANQTQNSTTITFELATPYTVINDGKNRAVDMKQEEIPATFEYFCVPKKEKKAFLVAHVVNWLDYNLMDGEVNLYYEGTYTGKTAFSLANAEDTLNLSLGQDKGITVNRVQVKEFSKRQVLSDKKVASASFEITIRNNKKFPINLVIEDQIPVSVEKDITVENPSYEGAQLEEATGKLTWKLSLDPAKEKKLKLSYTVKYPKSYRLQID